MEPFPFFIVGSPLDCVSLPVLSLQKYVFHVEDIYQYYSLKHP